MNPKERILSLKGSLDGMNKSPNLNLTLTSASEDTKNFIDFRNELAGDNKDSNMMILDAEVGRLKERCGAYDTRPVTWGMLKNGMGSNS